MLAALHLHVPGLGVLDLEPNGGHGDLEPNGGRGRPHLA